MNQNNQLSAEEIRARLIVELELQDAPEAEQNEIIGNLSSILIDRAMLAIMTLLPKEEFDRFSALLEEGKTAEVEEGVKNFVPNAREIIENTDI